MKFFFDSREDSSLQESRKQTIIVNIPYHHLQLLESISSTISPENHVLIIDGEDSKVRPKHLHFKGVRSPPINVLVILKTVLPRWPKTLPTIKDEIDDPEGIIIYPKAYNNKARS